MIDVRSALLCALLCACGAPSGVMRIADGTRDEGRYIDAAAYSAYSRAALLEAAGDRDGALRAFHAALEVDGDSADIFTRIGGLHCQLAKDPKRRTKASEAAFAAFDEAVELDASYSAAYAARALCFESLGELGKALDQALRAVRYDPDRIELTDLVTRLLLSLGRKAEAWAWLDALVARQPMSPHAWRVFRLAAELDRDTTRLRRARAAEQGLGIGPPDDRRSAALHREAIDALLLARDLEGARRAAVTQRWSASLLAVRSAELGSYEVALEQARFVLAADPSDADAWVAMLVAAEQLRDRTTFEVTLEMQRLEPAQPSARAVELLARLLARYAGEEASRALRDAYARTRQ